VRAVTLLLLLLLLLLLRVVGCILGAGCSH
jgi:hypothetical protein